MLLVVVFEWFVVGDCDVVLKVVVEVGAIGECFGDVDFFVFVV